MQANRTYTVYRTLSKAAQWSTTKDIEKLPLSVLQQFNVAASLLQKNLGKEIRRRGLIAKEDGKLLRTVLKYNSSVHSSTLHITELVDSGNLDFEDVQCRWVSKIKVWGWSYPGVSISREELADYEFKFCAECRKLISELSLVDYDD